MVTFAHVAGVLLVGFAMTAIPHEASAMDIAPKNASAVINVIVPKDHDDIHAAKRNKITSGQLALLNDDTDVIREEERTQKGCPHNSHNNGNSSARESGNKDYAKCCNKVIPGMDDLLADDSDSTKPMIIEHGQEAGGIKLFKLEKKMKS
jgi:hypothetical protein